MTQNAVKVSSERAKGRALGQAVDALHVCTVPRTVGTQNVVGSNEQAKVIGMTVKSLVESFAPNCVRSNEVLSAIDNPKRIGKDAVVLGRLHGECGSHLRGHVHRVAVGAVAVCQGISQADENWSALGRQIVSNKVLKVLGFIGRWSTHSFQDDKNERRHYKETQRPAPVRHKRHQNRRSCQRQARVHDCYVATAIRIARFHRGRHLNV